MSPLHGRQAAAAGGARGFLNTSDSGLSLPPTVPRSQLPPPGPGRSPGRATRMARWDRENSRANAHGTARAGAARTGVTQLKHTVYNQARARPGPQGPFAAGP